MMTDKRCWFSNDSYNVLRLVLGAVAFLFAWPASQKVEYERSIDSLFPRQDQAIQDFHWFQRTFGSSQVILVVYEDPQLFDPEGKGIKRVAGLSEELRQGPGIADVFSAATLDGILRQWGSSIFSQDAVAQQCRQIFEGFTHSADGRIAAVACLLDEPYVAQHGRRPIMDFLRAFVDRHTSALGKIYLVGEPVMVSESFRYLENDSQRLSYLTTILLGITILASVRSVRWALISMIIVQWTLVLTAALIYWSGLRLSMVSSMLSAVITVVAVATVMHLAVGHQRRISVGLPPAVAWQQTWSELRAPVAWACITDALGFLALRAAAVGPVRDFGLMMTIGCLVVWVAVVWLVPPMATLAAHVGQLSSPEGGWLPTVLVRMGTGAARRAELTCLAVVALALVSAAGNARLEIESDFTKNFRAESSIAQAYQFVESRFGGAGVWDVVLPAPLVVDKQYVDRVLALEDKLRQILDPETGQPAFSKVLSLADLVHAARQQKLIAYLPVELQLRALQLLAPKVYYSFRATDPDSGKPCWRVTLRAYDRRRAATKKALIAQVRTVVEESLPVHVADQSVRISGFYVLLTQLVSGVIRDQWLCFAVAIASVGLSMAVAMRHLGAAVAALLTNILPIVVALGALGWAGVHVNMGAAMMAAVSMGLAVDSSLHYLFVYLRARRRGESLENALHEAQRTVGRALLYATLALGVGFASLATSDFMPTVYFGLLAAGTLAGSLLGNLTMLPALLALGARLFGCVGGMALPEHKR
jgi:hypothetical protein